MTIYYDAQQGPVFAALHYRHTVFGIIKSWEYWVFVSLHVVLIMTMKWYWTELINFRWEAAGVMQIFMMFMLIFYNTSCYERYQNYYSACTSVLRHAVLFTSELCTTMPFEDAEQHRVTATRYILAAVYLFYMSVTGNLDEDSWDEVKRKGLLQPSEMKILQDYPARTSVLLVSWAMQVCCVALHQECFWQPRSCHIGHIHNRLNAHALGMLTSCNRISNLLANPIPYPYYQLMNFILLFNFLVIAFGLATVKSWFTTVPFMFAVVAYMGLREVSIDLSEPFDDREADLPVHLFLDHVFDHSVGLLEAFSHPMAYERIEKLVQQVHNFGEKELWHSSMPLVKYNHKKRRFIWEDDHRPLNHMPEADIKKYLSHAIVDADDLKHTISAAGISQKEIKELAVTCSCGKVLLPDDKKCKRCGRVRPKQIEVDLEEMARQEAEDEAELEAAKAALEELSPFEQMAAKAMKEDEHIEETLATDEALQVLHSRRMECEKIRDQLGGAKIRLAVLQAAAAGDVAWPAGRFENTLKAAKAWEDANINTPAGSRLTRKSFRRMSTRSLKPWDVPDDAEDKDKDKMSPALQRGSQAYNTRWSQGMGQPESGQGLEALSFEQARSQMRGSIGSMDSWASR